MQSIRLCNLNMVQYINKRKRGGVMMDSEKMNLILKNEIEMLAMKACMLETDIRELKAKIS